MKIDDMGKHIIRTIIDQAAVRNTSMQQPGKPPEAGRPGDALQKTINQSIEVEKEFAPRTNLINTVSKRIAAASYNHELQQQVAEKVSQSPPVRALMDEIAAAHMEDGKSQAAENARAKLQNGFYRDNGVLKSMAERIIGSADKKQE